MIGTFFALISSLFFSAYIIPRKLSNQTPLAFSFYMACGFSLGSILIYLLFPSLHAAEKLNSYLWWSVLAGAIWAISFVTFVKAIDLIGLAKSNQWKNLQGPIGALLVMILFKEYSTAHPFYVSLAAFLVFVSALFFTIPNRLDVGKRDLKSGVFFALLSGIGFGTVATIQKLVTLHVGIYSQQVVWSFSIVLSLLLISIFKKQLNHLTKGNYKLGILGGVIYLGASYCQLLSYRYIEASIGFTLIQLNALWTILIGIFFFKEIDLKVYRHRVSLGLLSAVLGICLLYFSKK